MPFRLAGWMGLVAIPVVLLSLVGVHRAWGAITAEQRKEIADIRKDVTDIKAPLPKKGKVDPAEVEKANKELSDAETKLLKIAKDAGVKETDLTISGVMRLISQKRQQIPVSFEKHIGPMLAGKCGNCHGEDKQDGRLRLDSYAEMAKGGRGGALLIPGNPTASLIMRRITATDANSRMPRGGNKLADGDIQKISLWISQGAKFDGELATASSKPASNAPSASANVIVNRPSGNETVSFTEHIAPWMVNLCMNCHSGRNARNGFSLETFEDLMRGGRNGRVVIPGNLKDSKLWQLVGEQDPIKMPPGQALITRTNHKNLRIWIEEGAKFDGDNAKAKLAVLVPTSREAREKQLAEMSAEDFEKLHRKEAAEMWKKTFPNDPPLTGDSKEFIIMGNVNETRLKQVGDWAKTNAETLRRAFALKGEIWRGKLAIHVFKDRFSYSEFTQTNEEKELGEGMLGHARVTAKTLEECYVAVQDLTEDSASGAPSMPISLLEQMTTALLQRSDKKVPEWALRGTGLSIASRSFGKHPYFETLQAQSADALKGIGKGDEVFKDGTFSPQMVRAVGYTLANHFVSVGGEPNYIRFVTELQSGTNLNGALDKIYKAKVEQVGVSFLDAMAGRKPAPATKKK